MATLVSGLVYSLKKSLKSELLVTTSMRVEFTLPDDFRARWTPTFKIYKQGSIWTTDIDLTTITPTGTTKWVSTTGNDTTGDGSESNPYRSLAKAYAVGAVVIKVKAGIYTKSYGLGVSWNPLRSMYVVSADGPGKAILVNSYDTLTWTQQASPNDSVYLATLPVASSIVTAVDLTAPRRSNEYLKDKTSLVPYQMTLATSIETCQSTPGSYYVSGTSMYVRTFDGRAPDSNILPISTDGITFFGSTTDKTFVLEGFELWGRRGIRTEHNFANTNTVAAKSCAVRYSNESGMNQYRVQGTKLCIFIDCEATDHTLADGFSYASASAAALCTAVEIDCISKRFGSGSADNYNCYTSHDNSAVIRINCYGENCYGPVFADVKGAFSVNLGCSGANSLAAVMGQRTVFQSGTLADAAFGSIAPKMWLMNCTASGSNYARVAAYNGSVLDMGNFTDNTTLHDYTSSGGVISNV